MLLKILRKKYLSPFPLLLSYKSSPEKCLWFCSQFLFRNDKQKSELPLFGQISKMDDVLLNHTKTNTINTLSSTMKNLSDGLNFLILARRLKRKIQLSITEQDKVLLSLRQVVQSTPQLHLGLIKKILVFAKTYNMSEKLITKNLIKKILLKKAHFLQDQDNLVDILALLNQGSSDTTSLFSDLFDAIIDALESSIEALTNHSLKGLYISYFNLEDEKTIEFVKKIENELITRIESLTQEELFEMARIYMFEYKLTMSGRETILQALDSRFSAVLKEFSNEDLLRLLKTIQFRKSMAPSLSEALFQLTCEKLEHESASRELLVAFLKLLKTQSFQSSIQRETQGLLYDLLCKINLDKLKSFHKRTADKNIILSEKGHQILDKLLYLLWDQTEKEMLFIYNFLPNSLLQLYMREIDAVRQIEIKKVILDLTKIINRCEDLFQIQDIMKITSSIDLRSLPLLEVLHHRFLNLANNLIQTPSQPTAVMLYIFGSFTQNLTRLSYFWDLMKVDNAPIRSFLEASISEIKGKTTIHFIKYLCQLLCHHPGDPWLLSCFNQISEKLYSEADVQSISSAERFEILKHLALTRDTCKPQLITFLLTSEPLLNPLNHEKSFYSLIKKMSLHIGQKLDLASMEQEKAYKIGKERINKEEEAATQLMYLSTLQQNIKLALINLLGKKDGFVLLEGVRVLAHEIDLKLSFENRTLLIDIHGDLHYYINYEGVLNYSSLSKEYLLKEHAVAEGEYVVIDALSWNHASNKSNFLKEKLRI